MAVRLKASTKTSAEEVLAMEFAAVDWLVYERQFRYARPRKLAADFAVYRRRGDTVDYHPVLVEIQGGVYDRRAHGSITGILADIDRLNAATLNGYRMLRFTPKQVDEGEVLPIIHKALWAYDELALKAALKERPWSIRGRGGGRVNEAEQLDISLVRPESYVVSVRLNADESRALTAAARWHGVKLSTWIKQQALEVAHRPLVRLGAVRNGD